MNGLEGSNRRGTEDDWRTRLRENATGIASMLVTAFWLGAMVTGQDWWLAALLVGYIAVVPLVALLFGDEEDRREWVDDYAPGETESASDSETADRTVDRDTRDALETLRERYAAGELTDEQFERKLERLLDTETLEDAEAWTRARDQNADRGREPEYER
ncbi:SHOCT domain-containing protein [Natrinema sp. 1APR25-10V2]|uniref:SHOCT domain-containing protein n=1 Tax=Natrinema sp. 1APR25-10V2 TaxID=2951081 RepID=UPI0028752D9D|nr:SHOCT domain-containing protein [Natrinema sp. 1APR25-10V2]MDS0474701.1 SHOCT domain-containing protein [Natrinema sp. 1APR25-10V2]